MSKTDTSKDHQSKLSKYTWWIVVAWTVLLTGLLARDLATLRQATQNLALREARAHFQRDEAFRFWSATHGGFYVPIDERTPPSPYLAHIPERDIETPSGVQLTLMNPAYAIRQMNEYFAETYGVTGHITSLLLLRPENSPDDWERLALESFEVGETEAYEFTEFQGEPSLRLMQPLITQEGCLKCHAHQGYSVGDVRGGVSVSVPLSAYLAEEEQAGRTDILSYAFIWLLGFGSIIQGSRTIKQRNLERELAQKTLKESHDKLEIRVQRRTSELQAEITIRKQAEKEILNSRNQLESIFRVAPTGIGVVIDRKIHFVNDRFTEMLGFTEEELIGNSARMVYPSDAEFERVGKHKYAEIKEKGTGAIETILQKKDGALIDVLLSSTPLDLQDLSKGLTFTALDITERVQAEEEKRMLEVHLRQAQKLESIGTLASGVAHEINNPLMGIMNYAQLIHDRIDPVESQLREFSARIIEETERAAKIVYNLLTFSQQDTQSHSLARMTDIVDTSLLLIRTVIKRDQITLEVHVPDDLPEIKCRSQQIQQVLLNLLTNARSALNERYPEHDPNKIIALSVNLFEKEGRRWLRTTVEDHGVGIPIEIRERIFDPFYTTQDRATSTGMGLSISLGIVQDHHGELTFESEENQYTRFYLDLPVDSGWEIGAVDN